MGSFQGDRESPAELRKRILWLEFRVTKMEKELQAALDAFADDLR